MTTGVPAPATPGPPSPAGYRPLPPCLPAQLAAGPGSSEPEQGRSSPAHRGASALSLSLNWRIELSQKRGCVGTRGPESGRAAMETRPLTPTRSCPGLVCLGGAKALMLENRTPAPPAGPGTV